MQSLFSCCAFAFRRLASCMTLFSKPFPRITPSHRKPGRMLNLLAQPSQGHRRGWRDFDCQRLAGSSQISIRSSPSLYYFYMPFYHSPNLLRTSCCFICFYLAQEYSLIVPSLFLQIVLACSGISKSDEDFSLSSYNLTYMAYSFTLFFFSFRSFLLYNLIASLFFFRKSSSSDASRPSILTAFKNSSASSPFLRPKAFLIPFETLLLFLSSSMIMSLFSASSSPQESECILLRSLLSDSQDIEETLSLKEISLSLRCSPSPEKLSFLIFNSPAYFLKSFAFLSLIIIKNQYHQVYV